MDRLNIKALDTLTAIDNITYTGLADNYIR